MDILYNFHPFTFGGSSEKGFFCASLPLKTPPSALLATHGRLFGIFTLRYPDIFPLDTIAKEILPYMERAYYERECESPHAHLLKAVTDTQNYLEKRILEVNGVDSSEFSFIGGCVWGSILYVVRCGGGTALRLYRDSTFGALFEINSISGSTAISSMSGYIQTQDVVVLYDSSIDVTLFPLSTTSLAPLDKQVIYSKLTQLFDSVSDKDNVGSISGFYIVSETVPAAEDDRILLADIEEEKDLDMLVHEGGAPVVSVQEAMDLSTVQQIAGNEDDVRHEGAVVGKLLKNQALLGGFRTRFFSRFRYVHQGTYQRLKSFLAFFSKGRVFVLGCMFLVLFLGLILAGKDYEKKFKVEKETGVLKAELLPKIEEAYKQGQYYAELNPERAKKFLQDAQGYLGQFDASTRAEPEIAKQIKSIDEAFAIVTKTYVFNDISPFFDLTTVNQNAKGVKMALISPSLVVSDGQQNVVYKVGSETRSAVPIIGQEDLNGLISAEGETGVVYAVSAQGIVRTQDNDARVLKMRDAGTEWGTITDVQVYGSSVYLLDSGRNQIWKYVPEGNAFGSVRNYISSESEVSLANGVSLSIDGNVWVGMSNGEVIKFFSGKKDVFSLGTLDVPLTSLKAIYSEEESDFLYVLDDTVGRIVVYLKKDGSYVSTYQGEAFKGAADVIADSKGGYLYILRGNLIYRVELREKSEKTP